MPLPSIQSSDLPPHVLKNMLDIISVSNLILDQKQLGRHILRALSRIIQIDSSVLFLADENATITTTILNNLDGKKSLDYVNYFCKLDPFNLLHAVKRQENIFRLEDFVDPHSFTKSEYYNDFYKPQKVHHKVIVNLETGGRIFGEICLHRPSSIPKFSSEDMTLLRAMYPYLVHALEHNELRRKIQFKDNLIDLMQGNLSQGVIVMDTAFNMIYMNQRARKYCRQLFGNIKSNKIDFPLPLDLLKDCYKIQNDLKRKGTDYLQFPSNRVLRGTDSQEFNISSRIIHQEFNTDPNDLFMITIEKKDGMDKYVQQDIQSAYHLTERETEIVYHVFEGLKNSEIAKKLFVSVITVKWHMGNIFEKVGVKNRTALIHKLLMHRSNTTPHIEQIQA